MSMTTGSFSAPISPDLTKVIESYVVGVTAGAAVASVVNPTVPVQGLTAYNYTSNVMRGTVTFTAGITGVNAAALRTFLVPPGATYSVDFADHDGDNAVGAIDAIDSVSFIAVAPGAVTAEASTLVASTTTVAGNLYVNFTTA
jgi:hypothetical protein